MNEHKDAPDKLTQGGSGDNEGQANPKHRMTPDGKNGNEEGARRDPKEPGPTQPGLDEPAPAEVDRSNPTRVEPGTMRRAHSRWLVRAWRWASTHAELIGVIVVIGGATAGGVVWNTSLATREEQLAEVREDLASAKEIAGQYEALVKYALQERKLTQHDVSQYVPVVPGSLRASLTGERRVVQITYPSEDAEVPDGTIVRGVALNGEGVLIKGKKVQLDIGSEICLGFPCSRPPDQKTIWIVTQVPKDNKFYPQGEAKGKDLAGPALLNTAGEWVSPVVHMGESVDGQRFLFHAVLADRSTEDLFKKYLIDSESAQDWPGIKRQDLPPNIEIADTVMVIRKGATVEASPAETGVAPR